VRCRVADRLGRDVRQVDDVVQLLSEYRIVHVEADGGATRPVGPSEAVRIEVELGTPIGSGSATPDG
jgi:predicted transcriptional regulator